MDGAAADKLATDALDIFALLFRTIDDCRAQVQEAVEDSARDALNEEMILSTVEELDVLATHHQVDEAYIHKLELTEMGPKQIAFKARGSVDCELQYGSDGDYERGDGLRVKDNYPLTCTLVADIVTPLDLRVKELAVDNSSFYE